MMEGLATLGGKLAQLLKERTAYGVAMHSPTLAQMKAFFDQYSLCDLLPYRSYDPQTQAFHNEHSVGFVIETHPLVGCTEDMQREISGLFQHTLPEESHIQFILWADPRIGDLLDTWAGARHPQGPVFEKLAEGRRAHLGRRVFSGEEGAPPRNLRCIIAFSQPGDLENPVTKETFLQLKDQVRTALMTLGVPVGFWTAHDLINTLDGILNFDERLTSPNLRWNPHEALNLQIPLAGQSLGISKDHIALNEGASVLRTYSVRREPDHWSLHAMGDLIGDAMRDLMQIPCPFMIHYGVHISHQDATKRRVQSREAWVERQARSKIGKKIPILVKQSRELDFVRHQQSKGERFVQTSFSVTLFCSKERAFQGDQVLTSLFRSKRWHLSADAYIQLPRFLGSLPLTWGEGITQDLTYLQKTKTTLSTEAANLLPLQGEWKGTPSPGMLLVGRRGQVFQWSPFDNNEGNYNVSVVGKSGSGKSVFMQELVSATLGQGGQVFVLDVGRSFQKMVQFLQGEYIAFTAKSTICINPFSTIPMDQDNETEDALAMLKPIVSLMAAPKDGTNDLENAYIEQAIKGAWALKGRDASMTDVADFLKQAPDRLAKNLGQKLQPYTKAGIYGRFFHGPATVNLSAQMVVIELEELKERKDLQEVIVQMVILQITNKLYLGDRQTPSHVVLDEAWDMLRGKQSGVFIETAARRLRKYRGSLVVGTQSVNDFYASPAAQAAFDNSDWMCLLSQKPASIKQLKESHRMTMDPVMEAMLTSVKTLQGKYAEVMIVGPHGYAIGRLLLDPYSLILYSTKPEDFTAVERLMDQGMPLDVAVEEVARRKGS